MSLHAPELPPRKLSRLTKAKRVFARWLNTSRGGILSSKRTTIAILKAQQEAMLDGVLVVDPEGLVLSYNRRFLELWGIPESVAATANDQQLLAYAAERVAHCDSFIDQMNYLYKHPAEVRTGDPIALKDGRMFMRASIPVIADEKYVGLALPRHH